MEPKNSENSMEENLENVVFEKIDENTNESNSDNSGFYDCEYDNWSSE